MHDTYMMKNLNTHSSLSCKRLSDKGQCLCLDIWSANHRQGQNWSCIRKHALWLVGPWLCSSLHLFVKVPKYQQCTSHWWIRPYLLGKLLEQLNNRALGGWRPYDRPRQYKRQPECLGINIKAPVCRHKTTYLLPAILAPDPRVLTPT